MLVLDGIYPGRQALGSGVCSKLGESLGDWDISAVCGLTGDVIRESSQRFAVYQSAAHCRACFLDGCRRGRIFHFSTAGALRNGYDSQRRELWAPFGQDGVLALRANWMKLLSSPAATLPTVVRC